MAAGPTFEWRSAIGGARFPEGSIVVRPDGALGVEPIGNSARGDIDAASAKALALAILAAGRDLPRRKGAARVPEEQALRKVSARLAALMPYVAALEVVARAAVAECAPGERTLDEADRLSEATDLAVEALPLPVRTALLVPPKHIDLMRHALGVQCRGGEWTRPCRNRFVAAECDRPAWQELVQLGLARLACPQSFDGYPAYVVTDFGKEVALVGVTFAEEGA